MRSLKAFPLASAVFLASLGGLLAPPLTGCAPAANEDVGGSEQASTADDLVLAKAMVGLLGGDNGACKDCHGVTASGVRAWGNKMKEIEAACFAPTGLTEIDRVNCLRSTPTDPSSAFSPRRLGLYAAGATSDEMKGLFQAAFPAATWSSEFARFTQRAGMPRGGGAPLAASDFAKLKAWVLRGMPQLDEAFAPPQPETPGCNPQSTPELAAHIAAMKTGGWGARLADQATPMFGCNGATSALECLTQLPDATATYGNPDATQTLRRLQKQELKSRYWVRSSADGRYIGYGLYTSSKIIDLTKPETAPAIKVEADYDPFFLPSNDGFAFAGSHTGDKIRVCRQSLLGDIATLANPSVSLQESKCMTVGNQVYESIGSSLDGERYFVTWGAHENDDGGNTITAPLPAAFNSNATTVFTPMVNDGLSYRAEPGVNVVLPREGDMMLSPSSLLAATRFGDGTKQRGYRLRFVKSQQTPSGVRIQTPMAAEICVPGQKAGFSFDERFMVTHQYVDRSEPSEAGLPQKSANIVIVDLLTGKQQHVTKSQTGVYALYPHFRADGWLYFLVRDMNTRVETMVASDIAVRMAATP